ncbi:MAG: hypothetical protein PHN52_04690 [candidate division Zixibacteria bacterium]|nr:hypothetical protein [candidate division Zixibacteria bacterium]
MSSCYIPAGRTSKVIKGGMTLQVQTEYASRPTPQITTTIINEGRVVHKIRRDLDKPISSIEEQNRMEVTIKRQHAEIIDIIQSEFYNPESIGKKVLKHEKNMPLRDRLASIPGVKKIFTLDNEGNFISEKASKQFQETFSMIFKNIQELMKLFARTPGVGKTREKGVYEIERDRLYFVSVGSECYFMVVKRLGGEIDYEQVIRNAIRESPFE